MEGVGVEDIRGLRMGCMMGDGMMVSGSCVVEPLMGIARGMSFHLEGYVLMIVSSEAER